MRQHRSVIAIDPGAHTGFAMFWEAELIEAGTVTDVAELPDVPVLPAMLIIELPVIYPVGIGNADPNDLITLAVLVGEVLGRYKARAPGLDTVLVRPRAWKGNVPKPIHNRRVLAALSQKERALLPRRPRARNFDHNMLDAVGLGLYQLERENQR